MIKTLLKGITSIVRTNTLTKQARPFQPMLSNIPFRFFCSSKNIAVSPLPEQHDVKVSTATVGEEEIDLVQTKGAISIMDRVPGVKAENG